MGRGCRFESQSAVPSDKKDTSISKVNGRSQFNTPTVSKMKEQSHISMIVLPN
jgi:hypothetical protein